MAAAPGVCSPGAVARRGLSAMRGKAVSMRVAKARSSAADRLSLLEDHAAPHRLLSRTDEVRLAKRIERGDLDAKRQMVECNVRLVVAVARPYRGCGVPFPDLVQEGTVGLVRAVEKFDYRRGLKFSTYAVWWIRRSVLDALHAERTIRIPAQARQQVAAVRSAEDELRRDGSQASEVAIAEHTGLSLASVHALRDVARVTASLDAPIDAQAGALVDLIADPDAADPADLVATRQDEARVRTMLRLLPERHRHVIIRRYGLGPGGTHSHQEIGASLGVGEERSRQLEREALQRLRQLAPQHLSAA